MRNRTCRTRPVTAESVSPPVRRRKDERIAATGPEHDGFFPSKRLFRAIEPRELVSHVLLRQGLLTKALYLLQFPNYQPLKA
ncbi:hypothetical protein GOODEAATRI_003321 [Goodea atripinnis]|uniref:Uncharacterized protein n=1 Tax=Goodea atripinnis TaxID=208336 RepID=A0ABV0N8W7_9TELE